jgi:hypothetical protein
MESFELFLICSLLYFHFV